MHENYKAFGHDDGLISVRTFSEDDKVYIFIRDMDGDEAQMTLPRTSIPEFSLAVLEVSGVVPENRVFREGEAEHLQCIAYDLTRYLDKNAERIAEAKEREELEAEAKAFFTIYTEGYGLIANWDAEEERLHNRWISFARKARELRKESSDE